MNELTAAIAYFEDAVRESDEIIAECSPELQEQLTEQKQHFVAALEAMRQVMDAICIHNNGDYCKVLSDAEVKQPCIEGPCPFDAVPVVYCGDCKYFNGHVCLNASVPSFPDRWPRDFCSHGKRAKMDGGTE